MIFEKNGVIFQTFCSAITTIIKLLEIGAFSLSLSHSVGLILDGAIDFNRVHMIRAIKA